MGKLCPYFKIEGAIMMKHIGLIILSILVIVVSSCSSDTETVIGEELEFQDNLITIEKALLCDKLYPVEPATAVEGLFANTEARGFTVERIQNIVMGMDSSPETKYPYEPLVPMNDEVFLVLRVNNINNTRVEDPTSVFGKLDAYLFDGTFNMKAFPVTTGKVIFQELPTRFLYNTSSRIPAEEYKSVKEKNITLCFSVKKEWLKGELTLMVSGADNQLAQIKIKNAGFAETPNIIGKEFTTPDWQ